MDHANKHLSEDTASIVAALLYAAEHNRFPAENADFFNGCANYYKANGYLTKKQFESLANSRLRDCLGKGEDLINAIFDMEENVRDIRRRMKKSQEKAASKAAKREIAAEDAGEDSFEIGTQPPKDQAAKVITLLVKRNVETPTLFRMGKNIVRLSLDPDTKQASTTVLDWKGMQQVIEQHTTWWRLNPANDACLRDYRPTPQIVAETVLAQIGPQLPRLDMIVGTPFFDASGNLVATPGYHYASKVYYSPTHGLDVTLPPEAPTREDVAQALRTVKEPFEEFPFDDPAAMAHTLAMLLQPIVRPMIDGPCPPYVITKPALPSGTGTGATLLAQVIHNIGFGRDKSVGTVQANDSEWMKYLSSHVLAGTSMLVIDNVPKGYVLQSSALNAYASGTGFDVRKLGGNDLIDDDIRSMLVFTGNAVKFNGEIARRVLTVMLNTHTAKPSEGRTFQHDPLLPWVRANRSAMVSALLVLVRSWIVAGMPRPTHSRRHSGYETYTHVIGGILDHVGIDGFLQDDAVKIAGLSDESCAITDLVKLWYDNHELAPVRVSSLVDIVTVHAESLAFRWLSADPSKWTSSLGSEIKAAITAQFDVGDGVTVTIEKMARDSKGQRYRLVRAT